MHTFSKFQNPVVVSFAVGGFGDRLISLPALQALEQLFPAGFSLITETEARASVLCGVRLNLFSGIDSIQRIPEGVSFDVEKVARTAGPCDLLISFNHAFDKTSRELIEAVAPKLSIGYFKEFDVHVPLNLSKHRLDLAFDIPLRIASHVRLDDFVRPRFSPEHGDCARRIYADIPRDTRVMTIHADSHISKMWPSPRFRRTLDTFLQLHPEVLVLVLGMRDIELDSGRWANRIVPCYGLPVPTAMEIVGYSDLFLGIDSCMLHAADFFGVPGVGLFGPTDYNVWGFKYAKHRHVTGNGVMQTIEVQDVIDALEDLWQTCRIPLGCTPRREDSIRA